MDSDSSHTVSVSKERPGPQQVGSDLSLFEEERLLFQARVDYFVDFGQAVQNSPWGEGLQTLCKGQRL